MPRSSTPVTWLELLAARAETVGTKTALTFRATGDAISGSLTYAELDREARRIASALQQHGATGERVLLLFPSGLEFVAAYFACHYAGMVAVPAYPPRANESVHRLRAIVADARATIALTTRALREKSAEVRMLAPEGSAFAVLATDDLASADATAWRRPEINADTLAMLQYTSGSTGQPKGVILTHGNLLSNQRMIRQRVFRRGDSEETPAGWLPLFHDMGLIGILMHAFYTGGTSHLMPPAAFLQKPLRWLQMISSSRATISAAPNFAYDLCVRRTTPEERAALDLSCWRSAMNGSEPLHAATFERFAEAFEVAGFSRHAFVPCYGMAEASLFVTGHPPGRPFAIARVDPAKLAEGRAVPANTPAARPLVSSGRAAKDVQVIVVDPTTCRKLPAGRVGEIWVRGPSVGLGYWNRPESREETFAVPVASGTDALFLRTGDLGFLRAGELFVTGRMKDLIIVRGRNLYPQDIEATVQAVDPALRPHSAAVFAVEQDEAEGVVVVQEVERTALRKLDAPAVLAAIREALAREHEIVPAAIVLVRPATIPKTSSGKIQRRACREQFLGAALSMVAEWRKAITEPATADMPTLPVSAAAAYVSEAALQQWLVTRVAALLKSPASAIDVAAPLQTLGLDSLAAVTLSGELQEHLRRAVSPTVVFDHPSIRQLARHFGSTTHATATEPQATDRTADERAIAIVGMGCRFPGGATSPGAFWELLRRGQDATGEIPDTRWDVDAHYDSDPAAAGRMYVRRAALLDSVDGFDPDFFGIAQREAVAMDPQHRLLLEVAWEAIEHAGIAPASLAQVETGVFVGVSFDDYARLGAWSGDESRIDAYSALGSSRALAASRLSYHLGLHGPSLLVDTLCSSSLLAVHLAVQSLRNGECKVALAGGANLILTPETTIASCKLRALAPDGRCKAFDAAADGYARGEGAGIVLLKRLVDARRDGDAVLAVIRGSAVNHDGRSNGLTAPNGVAQQLLLRKALADADAESREVGYVEAHGTGTVLGDPIEVQALGAVFGAGHSQTQPLLIGTAKTNIGHLESAAGIAGLIKAVLAVCHGEIPASLHFHQPNPYIPWAQIPVRVVDRATPWPATGRRLAGVSSFGLGGTNVHVLIEAAAAPLAVGTAVLSADRSSHVFTVSGHTPGAATQNAAAWFDHVSAHPELAVADVCFTANTGRNALSHCAALAVTSREDLIAQLRGLTAEKLAATSNAEPRIAFLFTGQGSQYAGMARELYATHPEFRATIDECAKAFAAETPVSLTDVLFGADETLVARPLHAQAATFAVELALGRLWLSWGVRPTAVFGHSVGEYAAACLAGVFSLQDAVKLLAAKARLTDALASAGAMLAAPASPERLAPHLAGFPDVEIAAFNGPAATTLTGPSDAIRRISEALSTAGIGAQLLPIAQAFHSRALEPVLASFRSVAETIAYRAPSIPLVACLHGRIATDEVATADYWIRQMREPVQFTRAVTTLSHELSCTTFLEIGPKPSLSGLGQNCFTRAERKQQAWLPSLRPGRSDWETLAAAVARIHAAGVSVDWVAFDRPYRRRRLSGLPTYAFQRRRCWLDLPRKSSRERVAAQPATYALCWKEAARPEPIAKAGEWLVLARDPAVGSAVTAALSSRGQKVRQTEPSTEWTGNGSELCGVIVVGVTDEIFSITQRLLADASLPAKLWIVTERAIATGAEVAELNLSAAPLLGFARSFALEHPAKWGGLIDLDEILPAAVAAVADELLGTSDDDVVAWRNNARLVPRLTPLRLDAKDSLRISPNKTQLVTGGTGALGLHLARWLASRGATHLVLVSRREPGAAARAIISELQAAKVSVRVMQADVADAAELRRVLEEIDGGDAPLGGVFHAAGVVGFEPLTSLTGDKIASVLSPKVAGARHLHELTRGRALDHFVLFSSIASVWGSQGQTHYAAANAFLDALAHERRRLGLPALSVNWGPWDDGGMAAPAAREQLRRIGLTALAPKAALAALGHLMSSNATQATVADVDWAVLRPVLTLRRAQPLLDAFASIPPRDRVANSTTDILARLRSTDASQRELVLGTYLHGELARVLGRDPAEAIDPQRGFFSLGMDSLMAVELRARLEAELQVELPATIAFDRASLHELRVDIAGRLFSTPPLVSAQTHAATRVSLAVPNEPIAIIGLGCRFPGGVTSPAAFWELLRSGRHGIKRVPPERWDADAHYHAGPDEPGKMYVREFGFVEGVDLFDHAFFNLYPREAASMDPQQRLLLETAWEALESAGLATPALRGSVTGTFVGVSTNDYAQLLLRSGDASQIDAYFGTGNALNAVAGRLAYTFGLRGPTLVTDTACSSSLVALHLACQSLRAGECTQAIAAGVNLMLTPEPAIALSRARMLAPDGRCKTFDAAADGYGRGEGCGVVVLKPLSAARTAGNPILAVISGSAVNQDGASSGFTVPSGAAQQVLIRRALAQAGRTPDDLDYIEAHGTGTPLGDPIEINAIADVVGRSRSRPLFVGSAKTNLGHLESAAGIAGVVKTVLALRHGAIPPHLNFTRPSPHIRWSELPVQVPTQIIPWPAAGGRPRVAGVSAFGFTGTNAHVILESAPSDAAPVTPSPRSVELIPLSARTVEALVTLRARLLAWLEARPELGLSAIARTFGAGRTHHAFREVYLATSTGDLQAQLADRLVAAPPVPTAALLPLAFVCVSPRSTQLGELWQSWGVVPAYVLGDDHGLVSAATLAGVFSPADGDRVAAGAGFSTVRLQSPRCGFGHRAHGRIPDALASSAAWWQARPHRTAMPVGEPLPPIRELVLDDSSAESPLLVKAGELYVAGYDLDWSALCPLTAGSHQPDAPTYPFQRRRHWIDVAPVPAPRVTAASDPVVLLGTRMALPGSQEIRFAAEYSTSAGFLAHHRLFGHVIASAAQHVALLIAASIAVSQQQACTLSALTFPRGLTLKDAETRAVQLVIAATPSGASSVEILSAAPESAGDWQVHVNGIWQAGTTAGESLSVNFPAAILETRHTEIYAEMFRNGYTLGPSFCWIQSIRQHGGSAIAVLAPSAGALEPFGYELHPGLIDSCFQLVGLCAGVDQQELADGNAIFIPASIDAVRFHRTPSQRPLRCQARVIEGDHRRAHRLRGDFRLTEEDGTLILEVDGFEARRAPRSVIVPETTVTPEPFYSLGWKELSSPGTAISPAAQRWSILGGSPHSHAVSERLLDAGQSVVRGEVAADATDVVLLLDDPTTPQAVTDSEAARTLALVQSLAGRAMPPSLWLVTRGAQAVDGDFLPQRVNSSAAIGLARIAALEHRELQIRLLDLDPASPAGEESALVQELLSRGEENQIALRGVRRFAARFRPLVPDRTPRPTRERLVLGQFGNLDTLRLLPAPAPAVPAGMVEVEVCAAGLNFRDVLGALGLLRSHLATLGINSESELPFGGECAGVVSGVGPGVAGLGPGDEVVAALATGSMGSHVVVDARRVIRKPAGLEFSEAATLPIAYLTAWHALKTLADVQPGERVLVHAAAGGVGIAAIHVARLLGAEVLGTASPAKWPALRELGVVTLGHSRQLDYAKEFPRVHVVINSLVGEHIPASLDLLEPGGRFVEIGKLGIWSAAQVTERRPDIRYLPFDLVEISQRDPARIGELLHELSPHWAGGALPPLPLRIFPLVHAAAAFRLMAQAKHVGKVVLVRRRVRACKPRSDAAYIVTGGLGGIGLAVARWLARTGAGTVVLAGRTPPNAAQGEVLAELRASGCTVLWRPCDLAQPGAATALIRSCVADFGAVRGVFHAAGVLDDGVLAQQTPARLGSVFATKARAAWELHTATLTQPLDYFVLFSSLAAVLGSPGQGTYAAANAALDALAHHRQQLGRPALSVNWGPWAEVGMSARLEPRERARFAALGLKPFAPETGIAVLARLLERTEAQIAAVELDPRALLASFGNAVPRLLEELAGTTVDASGQSPAAQLRDLPAAQRHAFLVRTVGARLAVAAGLAVGQTLATDRDLTSLGFDSLAAVELKTWVAGDFGVEIPMQQIAGLSLDALARVILDGLELGPGAAKPAAPRPIEDVLRSDSELPAEIQPSGRAAHRGVPRHVMLTGATGFLGAFLLHELLTTTSATIHCLVRASSVGDGFGRIRENLRSYALPSEHLAQRVVPVPGDLAAPRFGLDAGAFETLGQTIDTIYHNGAWLNFFYAYEALKAANVGGTIEVFRLAATGLSKSVHYVSTSGVFYSRAYRGRALPETDAAEECDGHVLGYSQSKWVAERLVTAAAGRGFAVTTHRAPFITGHAETGAWNSDDFICRLVRGIVALGAMPDLAATMDIVPVDHVARGIVRLSLQEDAAGGRFHYCAAEQVNWSALAGWLSENGYVVERETYGDWLARLPALRGTKHPLAPFVPLFLERAGADRPTVPEVFLQSAHAHLDGTATARRLTALGVAAPVIDARLWRCYVAALRADGALPQVAPSLAT